MTILDQEALAASPLSDLHLMASELGIDGYRRLRKDDLIEKILDHQLGAGGPDDDAGVGIDGPAAESSEPESASGDEDAERAGRSRRGRRGGRGRRRSRDADASEDADVADADEPTDDQGADASADAGAGAGADTSVDADDRVVEGVVELLSGGSGFVRISPPEPSDEDVYISAAQIRRCELVDGDSVSGPVRKPRRSERYPSLVRVDTINGVPADEVAGGTRYDDLPCTYPSERIAFGGEDPTVKAIEWLTPIGLGSRVVIAGGARAGKTEALRRIAAALAGREGLEVTLVLAGARPEELTLWREGPIEPAISVTFAASPEALGQAIERTVEQAKRVATRGGNAVVLVDSLVSVPTAVSRKALASARNVVDGGSLTVIATASAPIGGETTVITLDAGLTGAGRFPALDLVASGTLRPDLLVGDAGAEAIAKARAEAGR